MSYSLELILGGARSGKSRLAEERALSSGLQLVYIATATPGDAEMSARIRRHQQGRDSAWKLVEEPIDLAATLQRINGTEICIVIDCLTLWLSNCLGSRCWAEQRSALIEVLPQLSGRVICVSNETGLGVVPLGELSRKFVDESGFLHQEIAAISHRVTLAVAGLAHELKDRELG